MDASTTTKPSYTRSVLIGGLVMGVLSALPVIQLANACCCLWYVSGGLIGSYLYQQDHPASIKPGDGAIVGLLAGVVGAIAHTIVAIPVSLLLGPMSRAMVRQLLDNNDLPPNLRAIFENTIQNETGAVEFVLGRLFLLVLFLFIGGVFSTLGGLLGAVLFSRKSAPIAPPPAMPPPDARFG